MTKTRILIVSIAVLAVFMAGAYLPSGLAAFDAFGRSRVSEPDTLADSKLLVSARDDIYAEATTGSGASSTFNANRSSVTLSTTIATAGSLARQYRYRTNYQPGKSHFILLTLIPGATASGTTKQWGYFDDRSGAFFQLDDDNTLEVCIRSYVTGSVVDSCTASGSWSLSNPTIDMTKVQIFAIDLQWLGVGNARFGVAREDGSLQYLHRTTHPNTISSVYTDNPNLPIRWYIANDGTSSAGSMEIICSAVSSEGGSEDTGRVQAADTDVTPVALSSSTSIHPLVAIRLKSTHWRHAVVTVNDFNAFTDTASTSYRVILVRNPTIAGTALSFSSHGADSAVEVAYPTSATSLSAEGELLAPSAYAQTGSNNSGKPPVDGTPARPVQIGVTPSGTSDVIVLAVQPLASSSADFYGSLSWTESF